MIQDAPGVPILPNALFTAALVSGLFAPKLQAWQSDNGDGTFTHPPLHADYPDPDIIRVGADFYFSTTTFVNTPGITLLRSKDLVNWEFTVEGSKVVKRGDWYYIFNALPGKMTLTGSRATSS